MAELLPNFYKVTHSEHINETDWVVQVMLNPQHVIYNGHFPQQPVVPGVCMLQIIKECIEKIQQVNPEKPDVPINKNDAFQKVQKRRVQEKR